MVTTVALTIIGCVLTLVGIIFNLKLILESQKSTQGKGTDSQVS